MKKTFKLLLIVVGFIVLIFCFYIYKLHSLAVEGNRIFELRCTEVNPPLITYKNSFLKIADFFNNPTKHSNDDLKIFYDEYIAGMREYIVKENDWLKKQKEFCNRLDFKLVSPWYLKQIWQYQYDMYQTYHDDAQSMLAIWDNGNPSDELMSKQTEVRNRRNEAEQKYYDFFDFSVAIKDWRKIFGYVPTSDKCTEDNMTIPETGGSINWYGTPTPPAQIPPELENISG